MSYKCIFPKLVGIVTPLSLLCTGVLQMNSPSAKTPSQNKTLNGYVAYNWSYGHFCDIFAYFGQKLVAMTTSLRPLQIEMSSLDWPTTKPPVISNRILVISRRNVFGLFKQSLVYGSITDVFSDGTNPISKQSLHGCVVYNWSYGHFCNFWHILAKI